MATANGVKRPVHEIRLGRVKAAIWENTTNEGIRHNVSISRIYKDGDTWKDSTSFGRDDLPLITKVVDIAHTWIYNNPASSQSSATEEAADF